MAPFRQYVPVEDGELMGWMRSVEAMLYPQVGYEQIGQLLIFAPRKR